MLDSVENNDIEKAQSLIERHKEINNMERVLKKDPYQTATGWECSTQAGVNFIDIIFPLYSCVWPCYEPNSWKVIAEQI